MLFRLLFANNFDMQTKIKFGAVIRHLIEFKKPIRMPAVRRTNNS
jgi:hypothetical protein